MRHFEAAMAKGTVLSTLACLRATTLGESLVPSPLQTNGAMDRSPLLQFAFGDPEARPACRGVSGGSRPRCYFLSVLAALGLWLDLFYWRKGHVGFHLKIRCICIFTKGITVNDKSSLLDFSTSHYWGVPTVIKFIFKACSDKNLR